MSVKLVNVSNPAAFGIEWTDGESTFQLVVARGTSTVMFGMKREGVRAWSTTSVAKPERFGPIPTDNASMRRFAEAFVNGEGN